MWDQVAPGGPRRPQEAPESPGKPREAPESPNKPQEAPGCPGGPGGLKTPPEARKPQEGTIPAPGGARKHQKSPGDPKRAQKGPGGPSRAQEGRFRSARKIADTRHKEQPQGSPRAALGQHQTDQNRIYWWRLMSNRAQKKSMFNHSVLAWGALQKTRKTDTGGDLAPIEKTA